MIVWDAPATYARSAFVQLFRLLRELDKVALKSDRHVELPKGVTLIMSSPNGSRWRFTVDDTGALNVEGPL